MAKKSDSEAMDTALEQSVPFQVSGPKGDLPGPVELACEAFGIGRRHLLAWKVDNELHQVVLLTRGGRKVTWHEGMTVDQLTEIEITGIAPPRKSKLPK